MTAKYMVGNCFSGLYRRLMFKDSESASPDYHLTCFAGVFSAFCALLETLGPLLCLFDNPSVVAVGILIFICMHLYIISTLVVDVFTWNFVDAVYYCILFGIYRT